jgi:hypothetical protein
MTFEPDYGQTLLSEEDQVALDPAVRELLGEPILKADLYDLEQLIQAQVADEFVQEILDGSLTIEVLLTDHFVRETSSTLVCAGVAVGRPSAFTRNEHRSRARADHGHAANIA